MSNDESPKEELTEREKIEQRQRDIQKIRHKVRKQRIKDRKGVNSFIKSMNATFRKRQFGRPEATPPEAPSAEPNETPIDEVGEDPNKPTENTVL